MSSFPIQELNVSPGKTFESEFTVHNNEQAEGKVVLIFNKSSIDQDELAKNIKFTLKKRGEQVKPIFENKTLHDLFDSNTVIDTIYPFQKQDFVLSATVDDNLSTSFQEKEVLFGIKIGIEFPDSNTEKLEIPSQINNYPVSAFSQGYNASSSGQIKLEDNTPPPITTGEVLSSQSPHPTQNIFSILTIVLLFAIMLYLIFELWPKHSKKKVRN